MFSVSYHQPPQHSLHKYILVPFRARVTHPFTDLGDMANALTRLKWNFDDFELYHSSNFGWNCERCNYLQLIIHKHPHRMSVVTTLTDSTLCIVNQTPSVYIQTCRPNVLTHNVLQRFDVRAKVFTKRTSRHHECCTRL